MAILRHRGSTLYVFAPYSDREKCQQIKGAAWDKANKCWMYPFNCLDAITTVFPGITVPDTIEEYIKLKTTQRMKLQSIKFDNVDEDPEHPFLMKHQIVGKQIAQVHKRFAFFWDTGTGKTIMAEAICEANPMPTLVICPLPIIRPAWIEDAEAFFPDLALVSLHTGRDNNKKKLNKALAEGWEQVGVRGAIHTLRRPNTK